MKKIIGLFTLMMLLFVTSSQAQRIWTIASESSTEIKSGEEFQYVLQEGFNTNGWSSNGYMNSGDGDVIASPDESCIYSFIEVDQLTEGDVTYPVYILKNVKNGMFLANGEQRYVKSQAKAFTFTARLAVEKTITDDEWELWENYSNGVSAGRCEGAEAAHAWVLCSSQNVRNYISFIGNPAFAGYTDTGHWLLLEAVEEEISSYEKLAIALAQLFPTGVDESLYPVGDAPGCVPQDFYNRLNVIYQNALELTGKEEADVSAEECDKVREELFAIAAEYEKVLVPVSNGYYLFVNKRSMDAAWDAGNYIQCSLGIDQPPVWNVTNALYIWEVIETGDEGHFYLKNWASGRFVGKGPGTSQKYPMQADSTVQMVAEHSAGPWFRIKDLASNNFLHNDAGGKVVVWNSTDLGNQWRFNRVPADTIAKLAKAVAQNQLNSDLSALVKQAKTDILSLLYKNGFTDDGNYLSEGLVKQLSATNCQETQEGPASYLFDGRLDNFFHSRWSAALETDDWHWIQVDLGKDVNELYLKMTERKGNNKNKPTKILLLGPDNGDPAAETWTDELAKVDTLIYDRGDSTTYVGKIKLAHPAQHIRLVVTRTLTNALNGNRPFWAVAEMRFYDAADCVENPSYAQVPEEIKQKLNNLLDVAQTELDAKLATQETYDALEKALEAFWDAYPDPAELKEALENAEEKAQKVSEGEEMGFFKAGAQEGLLSAVAVINGEIAKIEENRALTLDEIKKFESQLDKAIADFYAMLIVPESGKVYRIVSTAGYAEDGERKQNDACIVSLNGDYKEGTPVWRYKVADTEPTIDTRFNALWLVEKNKNENSFAFKNLANGLYMNNGYYGLTDEQLKDTVIPDKVGFSVEPKYYTLESYTADGHDAGSFLLTMRKGQYANLQPTGNVVHWSDANDAHAPFRFELVTDDDFNTEYNIDVNPGQMEIVTLPFAVEGAFINGGVYEVLGLKENNLHLSVLEGEIPAGTPFIVSPEAEVEGEGGDHVLVVDLANTNIGESLNLKYNYNVVEKNGLVSAPYAFETEEGQGFGILYKNTAVASEGGDYVAAGTGYFQKLPVTEAEGTIFIPVEGDITGEGTAIEDLVIMKNVPTDVYTISGVKIRQNVKASVATKGLPKGIYIVGGHKILVK